jgi:hypothetical protein
MAEVRAIPSAVGAYEAQVIDFNKTLNAIASNQAALRKQQIELQKEAQKQLEKSIDRPSGTPRSVDIPYLQTLEKKVKDYYFNNRFAIQSGNTSAIQGLKDLSSEFQYNYITSTSLSQRENSFNSALSQASGPGNKMSKSGVELVTIFNSSLDDPRRKDKKFINSQGQEVDINALNVLDLSRYKEWSYGGYLTKARQIPSKTIEVETPTKFKGMHAESKTKYAIKSPLELANLLTAEAADNIDFQNVANQEFDKDKALYNQQYSSLKLEYEKNPAKDAKGNVIPFEMPSYEEVLSEEIKAITDLYNTSGAVEYGPQGRFSVESLFNKDGVPGVQSGEEFILYNTIKQNIPQFLGKSMDFKTQSMLNARQRLSLSEREHALSKQMFDYKQKDDNGIEGAIVNDIKSGKFNANEWNEKMAAIFTSKDLSLGRQFNSSDVVFSGTGNNVKVSVTTRVAMTNDDESYVTDEKTAKQFGGKYVKGNDGIYYSETTETRDLSDLNTSFDNVGSVLTKANAAVTNTYQQQSITKYRAKKYQQ